MATSSVLVVDDEASIRRTLREILEYEDLDVEEAEDGEEALQRLQEEQYDAQCKEPESYLGLVIFETALPASLAEE